MPINVQFYEADTLRILVTGVTHDISGAVTTATSATYAVYRADGTSLATGSLAYEPALLGWTAVCTTPALTADAERLTVICTIVKDGATRQWREQAVVRNLATTG